MAIDLKALIAAKKAGTFESKQEIPSSIVASNLDDDMFFLTPIARTRDSKDIFIPPSVSYKPPDPAMFLAAWTPFLLHPYTMTVVLARDYVRWLLAPELYVLNTFPRIDSQRIFETYMLHKPPRSIMEAHRLSQICWDIDLFIPRQYEDQIVELIKKKIA